MANPNVRVEIPSDPSEAIALLGKVKAKHEALGNASPLKGLDWEKTINPAYTGAKTHNDNKESLYKEAEKETGERDVFMPTVFDTLRSARDVLLGLNLANPKKLGDFDSTVDDSPRSNTSANPQPAQKG